MIVCVCKAISDRQLRASIADGHDTFEALQFEHGVASCCGRCTQAVHEVLGGQEICGRSQRQRCETEQVEIAFYARAAA